MIKRLTKPIQYLLSAYLMAVFAIAQAADNQLEIISLQHRLAAELIPSLQPFVNKQGVIAAEGNQLIIRTSDKNLAELKILIKQLDQAPRRLLIEVRQPLSSSIHNQQTDISGDNNDGIHIRTYSTSSRDNSASNQQIQVLEGHTALIKTGQLVPMAKKQLRNGHQVETIIEQQDVSSGFNVTPRLNGDIVQLQIAPFNRSLSSSGGGIINQQQTFTTVSGKLGEWLEIGGIGSSQQQNGSGTIYETHRRNEQQRQVLIRVTEQ